MTICSYNNSGQIKFDVDIEMAQGYWNTSASRLWTRVRDLFHEELVDTYKSMRGKGLSYENLMEYFYGQQISQIPQKYYNMDYDIKYAPYSQYLGMAHGDGYQHLKRWLKNRLIFTDTLFDYAPSYNNDVLTIRANTTEPMTIEIETYTPVYQHVSWYNGQMDKIKIDGKTAVTFTGTAQTATDQEVLIYGGTNIKRIRGISSMNPNSMLIGSATRLVELEVKDCPILTTVNSNNANFSPHTYLNKLDISNCGMLGGTLRLNNSPLIQEIDARGTIVTGVQLATSVRNLETLRLPNTISTLTLQDASLLNTLEFDEGMALQSISLTNCNNLTNTINFDLTQTPTVYLDNSYNTEELYMSATTNLTLRNMSNLERVIYTPNNEYETFDINNVINGSNYEIHTFNNPNMTEFITTASHRESYNGEDVEYREKYNYATEEVNGEYALEDERWTGEFIIKYVATGKETLGNTQRATDYLEVVPNTSCTIITPTTASHVGIVFFDEDKEIIKEGSKGTSDNAFNQLTLVAPTNARYVVFFTTDGKTLTNTISYTKLINREFVGYYKDYGDITPNTVFSANTLDLSDTQFTDIKFLCTTDLYNLKVPTTMKNFYCDSAMDIDTEVITDVSYEVIHDELIEPYTTNYEGEVVRYENVEETYSYSEGTMTLGYFDKENSLTNSSWIVRTDFIEVVGGTEIIITLNEGSSGCRWYYYDENKTYLGAFNDTFTTSTTPAGNHNYTLPSDAKYIRMTCGKGQSLTVTSQQLYTPNLIPSSANGSLIFNMYSNNTTQPTSTSPYMWDLTGLKLNDFYTYGMNNWVKYENNTYTINCMNADRYNTITHYDTSNSTCWATTFIPSSLYGEFTNIDIPNYSGNKRWQLHEDDTMTVASSTPTTDYFLVQIYLSSGATIDTIQGKSFKLGDNLFYLNIVDVTTENLISKTGYIEKFDPISITMPQRMSGYSGRLVNADITPDQYPTMLYPLLVDTTLPITGKLDYTKYNGNSLAWAYAYTTGDVAISPLGSQNQGNITQDYNKLYGTDFVDIVDVWAYKDADFSNKETNENITKAYIELTSDNYTTRIDEVLQYYPNCTDLYLFDDGSVVNLQYMYSNGGNNNAHDTRKQVQNVTFMEGYFNNLNNLMNAFTSCINLVTVNNIPKSVTNFKNCFERCNKFNCQIDFSEFNMESGTLQGTFYYCSSLEYTPILPSNYTGTMTSCFNGCSKLVEAPTLPDGVTALNGCFQACASLTTISNIPSACIDFNSMCLNCNSLISVPQDGWNGDMASCFYSCHSLNQQINISSCTNLSSTFQNCRALSVTPNLPSTATCTMQNCFNGCSSLITPPTTPEGVAKMNNCYRNCTALTTPANIPTSCTNCDSLYYGCTSLTEGSEITEEHNINNINNMYVNCTSLHYVQLPLTADLTGFKPLDGVNSIDIDWIGTRYADYIVTNLGTIPREEDIHELVPEHLEDLYKDTIKLNCNDTKVTINDNETVYVESARYVEYIQGDGTNYIDIDIYANPQWKYELTRSGTDTSYGVVFDAGDFTRFRISDRYQSTLIYNNTNANYNHDVGTDASIYTVTIDKNKCYVNGELKCTATETSDATQFTKGIRLFKTFQSRTDIYRVSVGKLYSFKMWDENGTLQFDGRPCLVNEKYPCMYDEVSKKFFFPQS